LFSTVSFLSKNSSTGAPAQIAMDSASFELSEATITSIQEHFSNGSLSSEALTKMYLKRIAEIDKQGPAVNAVIEINPDAVAIARRLDVEFKKGKSRGQLHGIPVLIKDNIDTADKMMTTAGSLA